MEINAFQFDSPFVRYRSVMPRSTRVAICHRVSSRSFVRPTIIYDRRRVAFFKRAKVFDESATSPERDWSSPLVKRYGAIYLGLFWAITVFIARESYARRESSRSEKRSHFSLRTTEDITVNLSSCLLRYIFNIFYLSKRNLQPTPDASFISRITREVSQWYLK